MLAFLAALAFLPPLPGAEWIVLDRGPYLGGYAAEEAAVTFRTRFALTAPVAAELDARGLRTVEVRIDGKPVPARGVVPPLGPGEHELVAVVRNHDGPPALRVLSRGFGLASGPSWDVSADGKTWEKAAVAGRLAPSAFALSFGPPLAAAAKGLPGLLAALAVCVLVLRRAGPLRAERARFVLFGAWIALALNDAFALPLGAGFDAEGHVDYVIHLVNRRALPLPGDGWEMFQAPLYYLLQAPVLWLTASLRALRVMGLICGLIQIELCWRAARVLFPKRDDLQLIGALFGFLPVNIYLSQFVGNEPLSAVLSASAVLFCWTGRSPLIVGALLGAAILAKVSAVLLFIPIAVFIGRRGVLQFSFAVAAVSGWWFLRNYMSFGQFVASGWDPARGFAFWQQPGYRLISDFFVFGRVFEHPVYAATAGFWDSLYSTFWVDGFWGGSYLPQVSPRWNYPFVVLSVWTSVLPMSALLLGMIRSVSVRDSKRPFLLFSSAAVLIYLSALAAVYIRHPYFSTAKAGYMLALMPCFAALGAAGFERLLSAAKARPYVLSWLGAWALSVYAAYWAP